MNPRAFKWITFSSKNTILPSCFCLLYYEAPLSDECQLILCTHTNTFFVTHTNKNRIVFYLPLYILWWYFLNHMKSYVRSTISMFQSRQISERKRKLKAASLWADRVGRQCRRLDRSETEFARVDGGVSGLSDRTSSGRLVISSRRRGEKERANEREKERERGGGKLRVEGRDYVRAHAGTR